MVPKETQSFSFTARSVDSSLMTLCSICASSIAVVICNTKRNNMDHARAPRELKTACTSTRSGAKAFTTRTILSTFMSFINLNTRRKERFTGSEPAITMGKIQTSRQPKMTITVSKKFETMQRYPKPCARSRNINSRTKKAVKIFSNTSNKASITEERVL